MSAEPFKAYQWSRESKRRGYREVLAVVFVVPDEEPVTVARFHEEGQPMSAAQAIAHFRSLDDPSGLEVRIARGIPRSEITALRTIPKAVGWRYYPEAKGTEPQWPPPGEIRARKIKQVIERKTRSPFER